MAISTKNSMNMAANKRASNFMQVTGSARKYIEKNSLSIDEVFLIQKFFPNDTQKYLIEIRIIARKNPPAFFVALNKNPNLSNGQKIQLLTNLVNDDEISALRPYLQDLRNPD